VLVDSSANVALVTHGNAAKVNANLVAGEEFGKNRLKANARGSGARAPAGNCRGAELAHAVPMLGWARCQSTHTSSWCSGGNGLPG